MREQGIEPALPYVEFPYLVDWLMEAGPLDTSGGGRSPISWREIDAWANATGADPQPWERLLIKTLSAVFAAETARAEDPEAPSPEAEVAIDRASVGHAVREAFAEWKRRT